jgi:ribosomal protein L40E
MTISEEQSENSKLCSTCAEPIPLRAKKCIQCDSYQDWRQYLTFSTANLALITAIISIIASSLPSVYNLTVEYNSHLLASFQGIQDNSIVLIVANTGKRPGSAGKAYIQIDPWDGPILNDVPHSADENYGIVDAGSVKAVIFESPAPTDEDKKAYKEHMHPSEHQKCTLKYELIDFHQNITVKEENISCDEAEQLLAHEKHSFKEI